MDNNITNYSCSNVEAMVNSVKANSDIINNMIKYTKNNDKEISTRLSDYAKVRKNLGQEQIDMFKNYADSKQSIEHELKYYVDKFDQSNTMHQMTIELHNIDSDYSALHKLFEEINKMQVKLMEMLCGLIGQANSLLSCL